MIFLPGRKQMTGFHHMVSLEEATSRMLSVKWKKPDHSILKADDCFGLISNSALFAARDVPDQRISAVDGYAIRSLDTLEIDAMTTRDIPISGISEAGKRFSGSVPPGTCCEIYTGATVPDECDSVIMAEDVLRHGNSIRISEKIQSGKNVRPKGEDLKAGSLIASPGDLLNSYRIAACISSGITEIDVLHPIRVSVVSTGDELMEGSERRIANSSQTLFVNYFNRRWLNFSAAGVCPDDPDIIKSKIENTLSSSDIVVVTGGTSLGMKDLVPEAMHEIGRTIFAGINMRPGRTITLYEAYGKPVFSVSGLPGPGLTSFETLFEIFISEYLKINAVRRTVPAIASEDIELRKNTTNLKRVKIEFRKDGVYFQPIPRSGLYSLLESDGVIQTDPESGHISRGDVLPVKINGWGV